MRYDYKNLYEKNAALYRERPLALRAVMIGNFALTALFFLAYGGFVLYAVFTEFYVLDLIAILFAPLCCVFLVMVLRLAVDRARPYSEQGSNITPLLHKKHKDRESFPSRHIACAFVIALTIGAFVPWAGVVLGILSVALGYIRFTLGLHYPSDLIGGMVLGIVCSLPLFFL